MDKATGEAVKIGGKEVAASRSFKAGAASGSVDVVFKFDAGGAAGKTLVVFEELYDNRGNLVAVHKDIDDKDQAVSIQEAGKTPGGTSGKGGASAAMSPKTGDTTRILPYAVLALMAAAVCIDQMARRRRKRAADAGRDARGTGTGTPGGR